MVIGRLRQSFSFHASPETFIASPTPGLISQSNDGIARAQILNRNVHIITSYEHCRHILNWEQDVAASNETLLHPIKVAGANAGGDSSSENPVFTVGPAYKELMKDFFPPPNVLLQDGYQHKKQKRQWRQQVGHLPATVEAHIRTIVQSFLEAHFKDGVELDLYEAIKMLSWRLLFAAFLGLDTEKNSDIDIVHELEKEQENLLRGQFSLFPVSLTLPLWQSARSRGLAATQSLRSTLSQLLNERDGRCPIMQNAQFDTETIASHCLLFTSSLAVKSLASLLTATILNVFVRSDSLNNSNNLSALLRSTEHNARGALLTSIIKETERLSPPVIGVMRRVQTPIDIAIGEGRTHTHHVPPGHDVWLYFVSASRDAKVYSDPDAFYFDRYMSQDDPVPEGFAFGAGAKKCLGVDLVRKMVNLVLQEMLNSDLELEASITSPSVRGWLGWPGGSRHDADFGQHMKQLPTQRPRDPILVTVKG